MSSQSPLGLEAYHIHKIALLVKRPNVWRLAFAGITCTCIQLSLEKVVIIDHYIIDRYHTSLFGSDYLLTAYSCVKVRLFIVRILYLPVRDVLVGMLYA